MEGHLKRRAQALFPRVEVTLKTADALLILKAGLGVSRQPEPRSLENLFSEV